MKLEELLKNLKSALYEWGFFIVASCLLTYAIFSGFVYKKYQVNPQLETYVQFFQDSASSYGLRVNMNNLVIDFVDTYPVNNWVGLCERGKGVTKFVTFKKDYFNNRAPEVRYALVLHELGHCVLARDHVEGYLPDGCPKSIMHPSDGLFGCFFKNQDYYLRELFQL